VLPVPPEEPVALANAVQRLRDEPELRERLSELGRAFAADYLRDNQVTQLERVLRSAADRAHALTRRR
jgi:glycosyltransferase involved in cell wall biosynthesis